MSSYERLALWRFLLIYVLSILTLITITASLYYQNEISSITQMQRLKMAHLSSSIASEIIQTHMQAKKCCYFVRPNDEFNIALFSSENALIDGKLRKNEIPKIEFGSYADGRLFYVDKGAQNHLDVEYIVIEEKNAQTADAPLNKILTVIAILFPLLTIFAYFLARLFLAPVREKIEELDRFIKNSTHELNTPITALLLSVNSLKKNVDEKSIRRIEASTKTLYQIYEGLSFSTLQSSSERINEEIDFKSVIEQSLDFFEPIAQSKKIILKSQLESSYFIIDERLASALINNILANAIKYNKPYGTVNILLKNSKLCINDNGIGIELKEQKNIFNRYVRANNSVGGFGIGLDIVKRICDEYKIKIDIKSELDIGTNFCLFL